MSYKIVALIGESGSGKDTILNEVYCALGDANKIITCTTRPPRTGEKDGVNYHFLTDYEFLREQFDGEFIEHSVFNNWDYGTRYRDLDPEKINIGVFNPKAIRWMRANAKDIDLKVYYIHCDGRERILRQIMRDPNTDLKEMCRRYLADVDDFKDLDFEYTQFENVTMLDKDNAVNTIIKDNFN